LIFDKREMEIKQTEEFNLAYRFITETNQNVFLTGKAGTGKTTFLKYLRQNSLKNMVVAAPTGVAAINAGGVTLHSLFHLPFAPYVPSKDSSDTNAVNSHSLLSQIHYNRTKLDLLRNLELLIIDEVSMVASHTIDAIDTILRSVRRKYTEPFGGVQVLFIGDLHQLPPVVKREEWEFLKNYYPSIFFFDSKVLQENVPVMVELKKIFRQQDNAFIEILNGVRNNTLELEHFEMLNSRYKKDFIPDDDTGYITLTTHNFQSDEINKGKLQALQTSVYRYRAVIEGIFPEHIYPAEQELELKEGAQVMFLKNDTEGKKYFNGKIGTITYLNSETIKVQCNGENEEITVSLYEWKNTNYSLNPDTRQITEEELGSFKQYPLRLAWAITIHKSQGLTFDKLIIDSEKAFASGQVYVALSRCTSLEGLVLTSHINHRFLGAHQNLTEWTEKNQDDRNLEERFWRERQTFILKELQNIFNWRTWYYELRDLEKTMQENKESMTLAYIEWFEKLDRAQKTLNEVAVKFNEYIAGAAKQNPDVESNEPLQKRIKDAANYFSKEISQWKETFYAHPFEIKTKKVSGKIDESLVELSTIIHDIYRKILFCTNGFILNAYLENGKKLKGNVEKIRTSYIGNSIISSKAAGHGTLYNRINELRKSYAKENNTIASRIFSDKVIEKICANLPCDRESLVAIKGISANKIRQYADEIVEVVNAYCKENTIEPKKIEKADSVKETLKLLKSGKTITEIAAERHFVESTIESHIAKAIANGLIDIKEVMPMTEVNNITSYFAPDGEKISLSGIRERVPAEISWGKLRMVLAWLQKEQ
jgi:hypothetical protein